MKRLTDKHPTSIKLETLFKLADELGITIAVSRYGEFIVSDNEWPGKEIYIKDSESGRPVTQIPPDMEYKFITEN